MIKNSIVISLIVVGIFAIAQVSLAMSDSVGAPKDCTQEYVPVCGEIDAGVRCVTEPCPTLEQKTFSNTCLANEAGAQVLYSGVCNRGDDKSSDEPVEILMPEMPLEDVEPPKGCTKWFDGRNTCTSVDGGNTNMTCTEIACLEQEREPYCMEYAPKPIILDDNGATTPKTVDPPSGCTKWFDGCNTCTVDSSANMACTAMTCLEQGESYCIEHASEPSESVGFFGRIWNFITELF